MNFIIDKVTQLNKGEILAYTGGIDGFFMETEGNLLYVGEYTGAIPYITDADFKRNREVEYPTAAEAQAKALEISGSIAVINLFCSDSYKKYVKGVDGVLSVRCENGELIPLH